MDSKSLVKPVRCRRRRSENLSSKPRGNSGADNKSEPGRPATRDLYMGYGIEGSHV